MRHPFDARRPPGFHSSEPIRPLELVALGRDAVPALTKAVEMAKSAEVRDRARKALQRIQASPGNVAPRLGARRICVRLVSLRSVEKPLTVIPFLLELPEDADPTTRQQAYMVLKGTTGQHIDFVAEGPEDKRAKAAARWKSWWEANRASVETDPKFLEGERKKVVKRLQVTLRDGTKVNSGAPKGTLTLVTGFGKLEVPWEKLVSLRAGEKESYDVVTTHFALKGGVEIGGDLTLNDGEETVAAGQIAAIGWVTLGGPQQSFLNGNTLISSPGETASGGSVVEVDPAGNVVWKVSLGDPVSADRLENGNTLIADHLGRVVEVDATGSTVWEKNGLAQPYDAHCLPNGNTLIPCLGTATVIEIDPTGNVVWQKPCHSVLRAVR